MKTKTNVKAGALAPTITSRRRRDCPCEAA